MGSSVADPTQARRRAPVDEHAAEGPGRVRDEIGHIGLPLVIPLSSAAEADADCDVDGTTGVVPG